MPNNDEMRPVIRLSFCGKTQDQVDRLIAGHNCYICNECIDLCNSILDDEYIPVETIENADDGREIFKEDSFGA